MLRWLWLRWKWRRREINGHVFRFDAFCETHDSFDCFSTLRTSEQEILLSR